MAFFGFRAYPTPIVKPMWPFFIAAGVVVGLVLILSRQSPLPTLRHVSWGVLPLVAGLFILVEALGQTGVLAKLTDLLHVAAAASAGWTATIVGVAAAIGTSRTSIQSVM